MKEKNHILEYLYPQTIIDEKVRFLINAWLKSDSNFNKKVPPMQLEAFINVKEYEHKRQYFEGMSHLPQPDIAVSLDDYFFKGDPVKGNLAQTIKELANYLKLETSLFIKPIIYKDDIPSINITMVLGNRTFMGSFDDYWNEVNFKIG